jgi:guanylate kinase
MERSGILFIFVGPSGCGKTSLVQHLCGLNWGLFPSVSATTRLPRDGEVDGKAYYFMSRDEFVDRTHRGEFFEWEEVHGNLYGTLQSAVVESLALQRDLTLAIDIRGALTMKRALPNEAVLTFILPPTVDELIRRVSTRSAMSQEELDKRMATAREEYDTFFRLIEEQKDLVDYLLVNDDFAQAKKAVEAIVECERLRTRRMNSEYLKQKFGQPI